MALPQLPPPIDITNETKRGVIDGLKKVIEIFQAKGILEKSIGYQNVIHDPKILYDFIQTYKANAELVSKIVVGKNGGPVEDPDTPLVCNISLAQVQQLLIKTCARFFLERDTREEELTVTETVTKTRFLFFKTTEQVERKTGGGFDERKVREIARYMAFDWQLPLLTAYAQLNSAQLLELGEDIVALQTAEAILEFSKFDQPTIKKAKSTAGGDFTSILATRPGAIGGVATWSKDMYGFYRQALGDNAFEFFCRDKAFYMVCASLEKPMARIYGDVLCYIAAENLEEMQRLNIDKADVLIAAMKFAFGDNIRAVLSRPAFAKDILRKLVESLLHVTQEKSQLAISAQITCKAIAPQVLTWLSKQDA
ncbi:hypothetical protein [Telmatospirillum siberiense]|uniref:Uncharacterized protein n=1 Tax=Telmatospirillum siberiense TaxID=382514 RepID=A0A2N3PNP4_9PROT|nr:hypothetical protein [Telmatospirillum siberiense]PKU22031.1 hypothetical protein CWS72_23785 [Telmatospirillum siberiense]